MSRTIEKDGNQIKASGAIIRGHKNKIVGNNNIIYGNANMGIGNGNRVYGDHNRWKGNNNILQGICNRAKGKGNKRGDAAVMENRKREREEKGKEEEEDSDSNAEDVRHQVVNIQGNNNVILQTVHNPRPSQRQRTDDNDPEEQGDYDGTDLDMIRAMRDVALGNTDVVPTSVLQRCAAYPGFPNHVRMEFRQLALSRGGAQGPGGALGTLTLLASASPQPQIERCMRVPGEGKEKLDEEADEEKGDPVCLGCLTNKRKTVNVPSDDEDKECGHHSYCISCARRAYSGKRVGSKEARCPECRAQLGKVILSFIN